MTQYTKPTPLPAWAESAGGADVLQPSNAEIQAGWPLTSVPPSRKRFNWILKYLAQGVRYLMQMGIPLWDAAEDYPVNARVMGSNGKTYKALQTSINQDPTTATAYWQLWGTDGRDDQLQLTTAFTTAGTAPNFTLTPAPAPAALTANLRFRVKFHAAGAGADQINIAGLGNKAVKQYDSTGTKVAALPVLGQLADVEYDGVDLVILDPLPPASAASVVSVFKNLNLSASGTGNAVTATIDEIILSDVSNSYKTIRGISGASFAVGSGTGAWNGTTMLLDTGAWASASWYSVWVISTPAGAANWLLSTSATAPALPSGYTFKARVGWIRTDGTANKYPLPFLQAGKKIKWMPASGSNLVNLPAIASGTAASLTAAAVSSAAPATAGEVTVKYQTNVLSAFVGVASTNADYVGHFTNANTSGFGYGSFVANLAVNAGNIYWAAPSGGATITISGWEDNI